MAKRTRPSRAEIRRALRAAQTDYVDAAGKRVRILLLDDAVDIVHALYKVTPTREDIWDEGNTSTLPNPYRKDADR